MNTIDIFPWNDNFNTGLQIVDDQHKKLVEILNELAGHFAHQSDVPALNLIFHKLTDYAIYHFQTEEAIWHKYLADTTLEIEHKKVHNSFIFKISKLIEDKNARHERKVVEEMLTFLTLWLVSHILETDRQMAMVVKAIQLGLSEEAAQKHAKEQMGGRVRILIDIVLSSYNTHVTNTLNLMREMHEHTEAEMALRESDKRFRTIIKESPIAIAFGRDGKTIDVNEVYLEMFGYDDKNEVVGNPIIEQIAPQCRDEIEGRVRSRFQGDSVESSYETLGLRKDGSQFPLFVSAKRLVFEDGPVTYAFLIDISQRKASEEKIRRLAFYDSLTNLPNRELLLDRIQQALVSSSRNGKKGALLIIDLDNFKNLNDTRGHDIGDLLLKQVAERLTTCVRTGDTVARLGGDEFVILLEELSENIDGALDHTKLIGNKILESMNQKYDLGNQMYYCSSSIGATILDKQSSADILMKHADIAMYQAKKAGRNALRFFDPQMQASIDARSAIESELRKAIENNEFQLYYQIQVDGSRHKRPVGAEALIRWIHPERGLIAPNDFIPIAEETGFILPIGKWVLENACKQLAKWSNQTNTAHLTIAVNVSAYQFQQLDFSDRVIDVIERTGINPQRLKLELTESMLLSDVEEIITKMTVLKARGVGFSLDDFGTGYSSLSYLSRLPLDQLKIDQSFVNKLESDDNSVAISGATINLAHSLNLKVVAEGVETETQTYILGTVHHCDYLQGYLFGKPMPIEQFEESLRNT